MLYAASPAPHPATNMREPAMACRRSTRSRRKPRDNETDHEIGSTGCQEVERQPWFVPAFRESGREQVPLEHRGRACR
jgi:hypothetical protein